MLNHEQKVKYTCQIADGGDKPSFIITAADDPQSPIISHSPSAAWKVVLKKVVGKEAVEEKKISGSSHFGLSHPLVAQLIKELPGAEKVTLDISESAKKKRKTATASDSEDGMLLLLKAKKKHKCKVFSIFIF